MSYRGLEPSERAEQKSVDRTIFLGTSGDSVTQRITRAESMSLEETIRRRSGGSREHTSHQAAVAQSSKRTYTEDVFKPLEEIIRDKYGGGAKSGGRHGKTSETRVIQPSKRTVTGDVFKSLGELIKCNRGGGGVTGEASDMQVTHRAKRSYTDDVFKALDELVAARGIVKPPSSKLSGDKSTTFRMPELISYEEVKQPGTPRFTPEDPLGLNWTGVGDAEGVSPLAITPSSEEYKTGSDVKPGTSTNPIRGPFDAVRYLRNAGMIIKIKFARRSSEDPLPARKWRALVSCGNIRGMAESCRRQVSREIACYAFLRRLKKCYPQGKIPEYTIDAEILSDPDVMTVITRLALLNEINLSVSTDFIIGQGYVSTFTVDGKTFQDSDPEYAQLKTAYTVYEYLSGKPYPDPEIYLDDQCDLLTEYHYED